MTSLTPPPFCTLPLLLPAAVEPEHGLVDGLREDVELKCSLTSTQTDLEVRWLRHGNRLSDNDDYDIRTVNESISVLRVREVGKCTCTLNGDLFMSGRIIIGYRKI